jgi:hypothetical protein
VVGVLAVAHVLGLAVAVVSVAAGHNPPPGGRGHRAASISEHGGGERRWRGRRRDAERARGGDEDLCSRPRFRRAHPPAERDRAPRHAGAVRGARGGTDDRRPVARPLRARRRRVAPDDGRRRVHAAHARDRNPRDRPHGLRRARTTDDADRRRVLVRISARGRVRHRGPSARVRRSSAAILAGADLERLRRALERAGSAP